MSKARNRPVAVTRRIQNRLATAMWSRFRQMAENIGDTPHYKVFDLMLGVFDREEGEFESAWFKAAAPIAEYQRQETLLHGIGNALNAELAART